MHAAIFILLFITAIDVTYSSNSLPCTSGDCEQAVADVDIPSEYRMKRHYDFVRFGRSVSPEKKASYDYIRFGKRSQPELDDMNVARLLSYQYL
ncbi:hypothetical protein GCK32_005423 [Trichostrongylus colubriformis]|uniref:Uncharacterized protein n=1 Tax=Trichostrongylus colubriformis TaxID=6319 RepID=A0AAN8IPF3_TRICO